MTHLIDLPCGRKLAYTEFGNPEGRPLIYHHGWPACRLEAALYTPAAEALGIRLIAVDRPGMGQSTFQPHRKLVDWPKDVLALADHLGLKTFDILGHSGGGPYTLACAALIPERLGRVTVVAGVSPMTDPRTKEGMRKMNQFLLSIGKIAPPILDLIMKMMRKMTSSPEKLQKGMSDLPEVDQAVVATHLDTFVEALKESFFQGTRGATREGVIYSKPWGFELSKIDIPVKIWQGSVDVNVPLSNSRLLAEEIPQATLTEVDGEGHLSIAINYGKKILQQSE